VTPMDLKAAAVISYCRSRNYPEPVPEYPFCPGRKYRADLAFVEQRVLRGRLRHRRGMPGVPAASGRRA
jgi:hypothetical protein